MEVGRCENCLCIVRGNMHCTSVPEPKLSNEVWESFFFVLGFVLLKFRRISDSRNKTKECLNLILKCYQFLWIENSIPFVSG